MFRRVAWIALASGVVALLVVPFLIPFSTSGTRTIEEAAGEDAEFVEAGGVSVHVERAAYSGGITDAAPPLIVLLHGFGASTFTWREILAPLSRWGDVIAYDRPGFGFSERPARGGDVDPYGAEGNIAILDDLIADEGAGREVIVIGHSAGGQLAAEYARQRPDTVQRLVLLSPAIYTSGGIPSWALPILGVPQIDRLGPILAGALASASGQLLDQSFSDPRAITDEIRAGYAAPLTVIDWEQGFWNFVRAPRIDGLDRRVGEITPPTLVITGEADTVVPTSDSERLAPALPDAELVVIPRAGHLAHEERPDAVMTAIEEWLSRS